MANAVNPYGDGHASERIVAALAERLGMKLLVTGGTGFIGSHLAEEGRRRGAEVVVLGLTDRPEERANAEMLAQQGVAILPGSITDGELCARAMRGVTHVFHLAVAMREGGKHDEFFETVNLDGTRRLLEAAAAGRVERFVYCSTIGIYGHRAPGITSEDSPLAPGTSTSAPRSRPSAGAEADAGARRAVRHPARRRVRAARPAAAEAVPGRERGRFPLFGDGAGRRHMVYVDDVVSAFFPACERPDAVGEALIVAGPRPCTLRELIDEVRRATGSRRYGLRLPLAPMLAAAAVVEDVCQALKLDPPIYRRRMDFFTSDSAFDTSRARRVLDWAPRVDLDEGVRRTYEDYRRVRALLRLTVDDDDGNGVGRGRAVAAAALSPVAEEEGRPSRRCWVICRRSGAALPRAGLRHRPHLPLPAGAGRHVGELRLRARPRPVGEAARRRSGAPDRRAPAAVPDGAFDVVAAINFLEHIQDDETFFAEMVRVLKPGRRLPLHGAQGRARAVPASRSSAPLGFTADQEGFGHARDGYPLPAARSHHGAPRDPGAGAGHLLPLLHRVARGPAQLRLPSQGDGRARTTKEQDFHGDTAPMSADALNKVGTAYKVYSAVYPALRAWTMLDRLIPFSQGYMMVAWGRKVA